jgi:phospho-N-acetylmuramoyl-pentapeptide-transferase
LMSLSLLAMASLPFWIALIAGGIVAYPILQLLKAINSRQTVSQYAPEGHAKKQGTPTMGGLIIIVGFVVAMTYSCLTMESPGPSDATNPDPTPFFGQILLLFVLFAIIGFVDDYVVPRMFPGKRGLGWKQKILMQAVAAMVFAIPVYSGNWPHVLTVFFLVLFFSNAYNFSDGIDALAGSLLVLISFGLLGVILANHRFLLLPIPLALIGATIPFLALNAPPAKVFMGDVGSMSIGAVLGAIVFATADGAGKFGGTLGPAASMLPVSLSSVHSAHMWTVASLVAISLVMAVELVPVPLQILSVKLRRKKLFLYTPIHGAFEKIGWPESRVLWLYALTQLVLSALAIQIAFLYVDSAWRWAQ